MNHLIFDFETMGTDVFDCAVVDLAYLFYDSDRFVSDPYTFEELVSLVRRIKFDVASQVRDHNFVVEADVLKFWRSLPDYVIKQVVPSPEDVTVEVGIERFISDCEAQKFTYWWTRNNTFDPPIALRLAKVAGLKQRLNTVLPHWKVRDTRSWIDAKFNFAGKNNFVPIEDQALWGKIFKEHVSPHDVAADVMRLQRIAIEENS